MKFVHSPTQIKLFKPSIYYQVLQSRGDPDPEF